MTDARQDPAQTVATLIATFLTSTRKGQDAAELIEPDVLELRLHGVANTAPQDLLDLPRDEIELAAGDSLGSFWQPTPIALFRRTRARSEPIRDRGEIPAGIHREAYSWGGLVRTSVDPGFGGKLVAALARAGWALLLPFAMANTAIWTLQLRSNGAGTPSLRAAVMRVAALLLTLLLVASAAVIVLDIVALQCFAGDAGDGTCAGLPEWARGLGDWPLGARLAALSVVPVLVVGGLWALSATSRVRYDVAERFNIVGAEHDRPATASWFSDPRYWLRDGETGRLAMMHFAAGVGLVAIVLFATWNGDDRAIGVIGFWISLGATVLAVATAAFTRTMPFERPAPTRAAPTTDDQADATVRPRRPSTAWHRVVMVVCITAWLVAAVLVWMYGDGDWSGSVDLSGRILRMSEAAIIGLVIAVALLIIVAACFRIVEGPRVDDRTASVQHERRYRAWRGRGPAVFLGMALGTAMIWSSLIVVGAVSWLNGSIDGGNVVAVANENQAGDRAVGAVTAPSVYGWFGLATLAFIVVVVLVVGVAIARRRTVAARLDSWRQREQNLAETRFERRSRLGDELPRTPSTTGELSRSAGAAPDAIFVGGRPGDDANPLRPGSPKELAELLAGRIRSKESSAARRHLAECFAGIFAIVSVAGIVVAAVAAAFPQLGSTPSEVDRLREAAGPLVGAMLALWTLIAVAVMSALVFAGSKTERPLAVVWDLCCFLPTTGHPLGPPTYLDRAAPEIARRLLWWLREEDPNESGRWAQRSDRAGADNVAVLVAHSMGAVLGTAALMLLTTHPNSREFTQRISFLSYGVQLRAFFGRFFPELLGPDTLGVRPCVGPRLLRTDPWSDDFERGAEDLESDLDAPTIVADGEGNPTRLPVRNWISLWRGNDELGFPAYSNRPEGNRVDRMIEEFDATGYQAAVATHGEYIRSPRYTEALLELADELRIPSSSSAAQEIARPSGRHAQDGPDPASIS